MLIVEEEEYEISAALEGVLSHGGNDVDTSITGVLLAAAAYRGSAPPKSIRNAESRITIVRVGG